jgi:hypothetical protein
MTLKGENGIVNVECHSGAKSGEYPIRFGLGDHTYVVEEILDRWYGPDDEYFKVRANDGNIYILRHRSVPDSWSLESFRRP